MRVWLPYEDERAATERLGRLPDGIEPGWYVGDADAPGGIDEVAMFVVPYLRPKAFELIGRMPQLQVVQVLTAGVDDVAPYVPAAVTLCNAAGVHDASTAELAVALILTSGRHLDTFARNQTAGRWRRRFGTSLADRRVLILGYGGIGAAIERRLVGFEVAEVVRVARRRRDDPVVHAVEDLPGLLPRTEVLVVVTPLTEATTGLVGRDVLALLPDGALVVNVARGKVVDTDALLAETSSGRLRAALDVTDPEPLPPDHPLWRLENVLVSPHVGGASTAFFPRADRLVAEQLRRFASGQPLSNVVER